ncbi:HNH endonuclease signature motif containing protein [Acidipropionibacterium acidipropionici]|uniref:HNH endonuclease signature motif containing protein n=1 Tax=Acidipropionibacterium acidipropionici TaxID=1748 RepID=UPI001F1BF13A|nr:HNH endonuclease signature motif containing protein [Acidipropionibacterium acidipropionici]
MTRFRAASDRLVDADTAVRRAEADRLAAVAAMIDSYPAPTPIVESPAAEKAVSAGAEGAGAIGEFVALEVGALLGLSEPAAWSLVHDVANLRARHPHLWAAVAELRVEAWQARKVALAAEELSAEAARWVDAELAGLWGVVAWPRIRRRLTGMIVRADADLARRKAEIARRDRFVSIRHLGDSTSVLTARMDTAAALTLEASLDMIVDQMILEGAQDRLPVLRARALEMLATPPLPDTTAPNPSPGLPLADVVVHIAAESLETETGVARVTARGGDVGPVLIDQLAHLLGHHRIRVLPVTDLAGDPSVDAYEIPDRIRRQLIIRDDCSIFPYSTSRSRTADLDHTIPYRRSTPGSPAPPGQTRISNLGPLARKEHRAKTAGVWKVTQPEPGVYEWTNRTGRRWRVTRGRTVDLPDDAPNRPGTDRPRAGSRRDDQIDLVYSHAMTL